MAIAWLLTLLALAGVAGGVLLGQSRVLSAYAAAAGGGLLFGISLFWLMPEIAVLSGWLSALVMTAAAVAVIGLIDHLFTRSEGGIHSTALAPLLAATAIHSFLDGWSVRALQELQIMSVAVPLGLALHKIPEGIAIGWLARRHLALPLRAAAAAVSVELFTLLGAWLEPQAAASGAHIFGYWWTAAVVAIVSGSFLFLAAHAIFPYRRRASVLLIFLATFLAVGTVGLLRSGNI